jgi:uncharacterized protein
MKKILFIIIVAAFFSFTGCAKFCKTEAVPDAKKQHGMLSWYELMTTDVEGAKEFYKKLFGWSFKENNSTGMPYTIGKIKGKAECGIFKKPEQLKNIPSCWGIYITVDNVDETAELAKKLGASILREPEDIPNIGRFSVIQDPQGAVIHLFTYSCSSK